MGDAADLKSPVQNQIRDRIEVVPGSGYLAKKVFLD